MVNDNARDEREIPEGATVEEVQITGERVITKPSGEVIIKGGRSFIERQARKRGLEVTPEELSAGELIRRAQVTEGIKETPEEIALLARKTRLQREVSRRKLIRVTEPFRKASRKIFEFGAKVEKPIREFIGLSATETPAGKFVKAAIPATVTAPIFLTGAAFLAPVGAELIFKSPELGLAAGAITIQQSLTEVKLRPFESAGRVAGSALSFKLLKTGAKKLTQKVSQKFRRQTFLPTEKGKVITKFSVEDQAVKIDSIGRAKGVVVSELPAGFGRREIPTEVFFKFKGEAIETGKVGLVTRTVTDLGKGKIITSVPTGAKVTALTRGVLETKVKVVLPKAATVKFRTSLIQAETARLQRLDLGIGEFKTGTRAFDITTKTLEPKAPKVTVSKVLEKFVKTKEGEFVKGFGVAAKGKDVTVSTFEAVSKRVEVPALTGDFGVSGRGVQVLKLKQPSTPVLSIFAQEAQQRAAQVALQEAVKFDVAAVGKGVSGVQALAPAAEVVLTARVAEKELKAPTVKPVTVIKLKEPKTDVKVSQALGKAVTVVSVQKQRTRLVQLGKLKQKKAFTGVQAVDQAVGQVFEKPTAQKLVTVPVLKQVARFKQPTFGKLTLTAITTGLPTVFAPPAIPPTKKVKKKVKKRPVTKVKKKKVVGRVKRPFVFPSSAVVFKALGVGKKIKVPKQTRAARAKLFKVAKLGKLSKFDPLGVLKG